MYPALNSINVNPDHYGVNLLQADGLGELYTESGRADKGDPFPGSLNINSISNITVPNTNSQKSSTRVSNLSNSVFSFQDLSLNIFFDMILSPYHNTLSD